MADTTPPTIAITSNKTALKAGETALITFALSEVATDFVYSDITVSGGTLSNFSGSGKIYTATFTPNKNSTAQGSVIVENFKFSDTAGNSNEDATDTDNRVSFNIDTIAPTIKIGANNTYIGLNESANLTFLLSEPSTSFDISDISISGGILSSFTGTGTTYSVVFTPTGTSNGFVNVSVGRFTDFAGNVNASASEVITLIPYNPSIANLSWVRLFGTIGNDVATGIATGQDGSIYVCGYTDGSIDGQVSNGGQDAFLTKYNSDGTKVWTRLIGTSGTAVFESDFGNALTIGLDGSIYISGYTGGNLDGQKNAEQKKNATICAFLTKFNTDGSKVWTRLLGEVSGTYSYALATGTDGSIYSTGQSNASLDGQTKNGEADLFLTKYSTDGSKIWTRLLGSSGWDSARAITTAIDGGIYICGQTPGNFDGLAFNGGSSDTFLAKFNSNGEKVWSRLLGTASSDYPYAIKSGQDGSIYVCGWSDGSLDGQINNGGIDAFLTKYSADGTKLWTRLLGSLWYDAAFALTIGLDGFVYVSGSTSGNLDDQNFPPGQNYYKESNIFVTKYNSDGANLWTRLLSGNGKDDSATGLATGIDGSIFISGYSNGTFNGQPNNGGVNDALLIKLAVPDSSVPQISLSSNKLNLNLSDSAQLVFLLTKPSSNFVASDINVQGGTLSNFQGSGTNYTAIFTPSLEGADKASVSVSNGKFSDALGIFNEDGADTNNKVIFTVKIPPDTTPPTIALSSNKTTLITGAAATLTFTLSETSTTFIASDVTVSGGTLSNFTGSGTTYTATFNPIANSTANGFVSVASGVFFDVAGNANVDGSDANNLVSIAVDTIVPTIYVSANKTSLIAGEAVTLTFTLSEASTTFTASDLTVTGGTISNFAGSGTTYSATFTPAANSTASGLVSVASGAFTDYAGNANADGSDVNNSITFVINNAPIANAGPQQYVQVGAAVTLNGANSSDPNGDQLSYRWSTVSKPINSASVLTNQTSVQPVFVADLVGTYIFSLIVNDGRLDSAMSVITVQVSIPNASPIANAGRNQNVLIGPVSLDGSASSDADGDTLTYKWFLVAKPNNSTATLVSPTAQKPTINTDITGVYVFTLIVSDGKLDSSPATTAVTVNSLPAPDITPPTIRVFAETAGLIAGQTKTITFYLSEPSSNFVASDVNATGGTLSNWVGYGNTYTALFTPSANTTANGVISVLSGVFTDSAGNANADGSDANNSVVFSIDTVVPTISLSTNKSSINSGETAIVNFTISEPSINFTASDVTVIGGTLSNFSGSGTAYTAIFTPAVNSLINGVISVSSGVFTDLAGNTNVDGFDSNNAVSIAQVVKDLAPPSPISFSPSLGETNVDVSRNIVITFNEKIQRGTGVIDIRLGHPKLGNLLESFNVATSDRLTYDGTTLTINPTRDLKGNYYLFIYLADGAVQDSAGNKSANISYYTITTANQITTENYSLSVVANKGVLGAEPVLLKGLTESFVFENGYTKKHIVEYAGSTFDYNQIDSLIMTVTRDGEFTEEFTREINDYVKTELNISYSAAVAIVGATSIDDVILTVAGSDGNYVG